MSETALISGASRGIGKAIALRLAATGFNVCLLGRHGGALDEVAMACRVHGGLAHTVVCDVAQPADIERALAEVSDACDSIDVLINNAGASRHEAVHEADLEAWRTLMDVNFHAAVALARAVLPAMLERRSGAVINISSISGRHTNAGGAIYAASKHALNGFSGCLFEDVRSYGIKVSSIMPGFVDTELTAGLGKAAANMIRADDVADAVRYILSCSAQCCPTEIVLRPQLPP